MEIDRLNPKFVYAYVDERKEFEIILPSFKKQNYDETWRICCRAKKKIARIRSILPAGKRGIIHEMEDFLNTIRAIIDNRKSSRFTPMDSLVKSIMQSLEKEGYDLAEVRKKFVEIGFKLAEKESV